MAINVTWHKKNPMPANADAPERVRWHLAHHKYCGCRPMPARLAMLTKTAGRRSRIGL
jgi:hypothetical protein